MPIEELTETRAREVPTRRRHRRHGLARTGAHDISVSGAEHLGCHCERRRHRRAFTRLENPNVTATGRLACCGGKGAGRDSQGHGEALQPEAAPNQD